jgi:type III pantothenate kinase
MLLVIDVGNTNTVIGVYDKDILKEDWRIRTIRDNTADEFNVLANALFSDRGIDLNSITKTVISSVVPSSVRILDDFCERYLKLTPLWINPA